MRGWWLVGLGGVAVLVGAAVAVGMSATRSPPAAVVAEVPPPPPAVRCREIQVGPDTAWVDPDGWPCVQSDAGTWRPVPR
jgi:hypothetical protein